MYYKKFTMASVKTAGFITKIHVSKNWISNGDWAVHRMFCQEEKLQHIINDPKWADKFIKVARKDKIFLSMISFLEEKKKDIEPFYLSDWMVRSDKNKELLYVYFNETRNKAQLFYKPYIDLLDCPEILYGIGYSDVEGSTKSSNPFCNPFCNEREIEKTTSFLMPVIRSDIDMEELGTLFNLFGDRPRPKTKRKLVKRR